MVSVSRTAVLRLLLCLRNVDDDENDVALANKANMRRSRIRQRDL
jgi:hypothetical protein